MTPTLTSPIRERTVAVDPHFQTCFYDVPADVVIQMLEQNFTGRELAVLRSVNRLFRNYIDTVPRLSHKVALEKAQAVLSPRGLRIEGETGNGKEKLSAVAYNEYQALLLKKHPDILRCVRSLALINISSTTLSSILKNLAQDSRVKTLLLANMQLNESDIVLIKKMALAPSHPLIQLHLFHTQHPPSDFITTNRLTIAFDDAKSSYGPAKVIELSVTPQPDTSSSNPSTREAGVSYDAAATEAPSSRPISLPALIDMPSRQEAVHSFSQLLNNPITTAKDIIEAFNLLKIEDKLAILKNLKFAISKSAFDLTNTYAQEFIEHNPHDPAVKAAVDFYYKRLLKQEHVF